MTSLFSKDIGRLRHSQMNLSNTAHGRDDPPNRYSEANTVFHSALSREQKIHEYRKLFGQVIARFILKLEESIRSTGFHDWESVMVRQITPERFEVIDANTRVMANDLAGNLDAPCREWIGSDAEICAEAIRSGANKTKRVQSATKTAMSWLAATHEYSNFESSLTPSERKELQIYRPYESILLRMRDSTIQDSFKDQLIHEGISSTVLEYFFNWHNDSIRNGGKGLAGVSGFATYRGLQKYIPRTREIRSREDVNLLMKDVLSEINAKKKDRNSWERKSDDVLVALHASFDTWRSIGGRLWDTVVGRLIIDPHGDAFKKESDKVAEAEAERLGYRVLWLTDVDFKSGTYVRKIVDAYLDDVRGIGASLQEMLQK